MKKIIMSFLVIMLTVGLAGQFNITVNAATDDWVFDLGQFRDSSYQRIHQAWLQNEILYQGNPIDVFALDQVTQNPTLSLSDEAFELSQGDISHWQVEVPVTGLYHIQLNYAVTESFSTQPTVDIKVNDEVQYNEMTGLNLSVRWVLEQREEAYRYNRFGNEMLPYTEAKTGWYNQPLIDPNGRYIEPLWFYLERGVQNITIVPSNHPILLKSLSLTGQETIPTYEAYQSTHAQSQMVDTSITIEGQHMTEKNDIEVKAGYFKGAGMSPSSYKINVLNMLSGSSMSRSGTAVSYTFTVEETGLYHISLKYLQQTMVGMSSARTIKIDDEIPFEEVSAYQFPYTRKWKNHTLSQKGTPFEFYLTAGEHTLTLEVTTSHLMDRLDELQSIMDDINSLGLAVAQITGKSSDVLIDWDIVKYLPSIQEDLNALADRLDEIYDEINDLTPEYSRATAASTLEIAAKQLRRLAKYPNRIPNKLTELNQGSGSAYQLIGVAINQLNIQPLSLDIIYLHGADFDLPNANANIFKRFWFSIQAFFYSFFDERYKLSTNPNDDVLEVWVGQSSLYLDIMQDMIDDGFTRETGIDVKLSVLPSTQKIVLNNATNTNPDVVLSIDSWEPYAYALRGMLADLSIYDGFDEMVENYHPNNFTPMIYEEGVYGMPETQGVYLLFYRKDILEFLDITPPDTWDDVLNILPILQSYQMNFYHPLGGEGAYKGFGLTSPFIYQFGGEIYKENGFTTTFDEEINIQAITFMTDIFNIYNLPQQVPSFFEHFRSGSLPVGIATVDMYLQLKYAAPELMGQWGMLPIPGMYDADLGEVARWAPTYGKASILFEASQMKEEGFELIKWWNSYETQLAYLENIKMVLGERYLFLPANLKTLEDSIWDQSVIEQALIQASWSRIPAITPGSYIVERELTNIWNKIVIDQVNPRVAIDQSIPRINRELRRKFEEFGYMEGGVIVREYIVPRNDNIENWIP